MKLPSSFGEAKQMPLPSKSLSCTVEGIKQWLTMCQKPAVVQVTELLIGHKQTKSCLAFCKSPVTSQMQLATPVVLQQC